MEAAALRGRGLDAVGGRSRTALPMSARALRGVPDHRGQARRDKRSNCALAHKPDRCDAEVCTASVDDEGETCLGCDGEPVDSDRTGPQFVQQRFRLLHVYRVHAFRKPVDDVRQHSLGLCSLALPRPQPRKVCRRAQLQRLEMASLGGTDGFRKARLGVGRGVVIRPLQE